MKQGTGISASVGAILSSLGMVSCCLPLGFATALGVGAASAFFTTLRPWLLGLSRVPVYQAAKLRNRANSPRARTAELSTRSQNPPH